MDIHGLISAVIVFIAVPVLAVPTLTIQPAARNTGSTLTLTCELAGFTTALMTFNKGGTTAYNCAFGGQTCVDSNDVSDYSEVDWSETNKGIVTISNADQSRDGDEWTCGVGGGGGWSVAVTLAITDANCGNPTTPTNGQVSWTTATYQSTATYSCDSGYTMDGTATTTCKGDGTWSGSVPTCKDADCGNPTAPTNGHVSLTTSTTTYLLEATYSCNSDYTIDETPTTTTCQADGTWSGSVKTCTDTSMAEW